MLHQLKTANGGTGKIYIEVPCFDWICEHRAWFDIFYEHVNYFRLADFKRMFGEVIESGKVFGGQYLYVIAELSSLRIPVIDMNNRVNFPSDFTNNLTEQNRTEQNRTEQNRTEQNKTGQDASTILIEMKNISNELSKLESEQVDIEKKYIYK